jgi:hypothetical protein
LQANWATSFGPKQSHDRKTGTNTIPLDRLSDAEVRRIVAECGPELIRHNTERCGELGDYVGGLVVEEPDHISRKTEETFGET